MADAPDDLMEILRKLSLRAAADLLELKHRMNDLGDSFDGTPLAGGEGSSVSREPRQRPGELVYEATRLHLQMAGDLLSLGHKYADFWLDRARRFGSVLRPEHVPARFETRARQSDPKAAWSHIHVYNARRHEVVLQLRPVGPVPSGFAIVPTTIPPQASAEVAVELAPLSALTVGKHLFELEVGMSGLSIGRLQLTLVVEP